MTECAAILNTNSPQQTKQCIVAALKRAHFHQEASQLEVVAGRIHRRPAGEGRGTPIQTHDDDSTTTRYPNPIRGDHAHRRSPKPAANDTAPRHSSTAPQHSPPQNQDMTETPPSLCPDTPPACDYPTCDDPLHSDCAQLPIGTNRSWRPSLPSIDLDPQGWQQQHSAMSTSARTVSTGHPPCQQASPSPPPPNRGWLQISDSPRQT
eukprot:1929111-Amphidinium_carterae.1